MGKRSQFERVERDFYPTPYEAVLPLLPHLPPRTQFIEPCCGDGALIRHLEANGHECIQATDIEPRMEGASKRHFLEYSGIPGIFITNPPWSRPILHPLIRHLSGIAPTWLLFDADWAHTKQSAELMTRCTHIVSVGRVKWFPDSTMTGKDNAAWYRFVKVPVPQTKFIGRAA